MTIGVLAYNGKEGVLLSDRILTVENDDGDLSTSTCTHPKFFERRGKPLAYRFVYAGRVFDKAWLFANLERNQYHTAEQLVKGIEDIVDTGAKTLVHESQKKAIRKIEKAASHLPAEERKRYLSRRRAKIASDAESMLSDWGGDGLLIAKDRSGIHTYRFEDGEYTHTSRLVHIIGTGEEAFSHLLHQLKPAGQTTLTDLLFYSMTSYQYGTLTRTVGGTPDVAIFAKRMDSLDEQTCALLANGAGAYIARLLGEQEYLKAIDDALQGDTAAIRKQLKRIGESPIAMEAAVTGLNEWMVKKFSSEYQKHVR
jgi:hypothetical protein